MSEYPWDFENMVLGAHQQPCDCAICDEIHFNRAMRKKRMKEMINYCDKQHGPMNIGCAYCEIDKLREENERFKVMYQGFENQALAIMKYRKALYTIAHWYDDVHDTSDFSGDTPSSYALNILEEQT